MQNSQSNSKKKSTKLFWRAVKVINLKNCPIPIAFVWVVWHYPVGTPVLVELFFITVTRCEIFRINWVMFSWQMVGKFPKVVRRGVFWTHGAKVSQESLAPCATLFCTMCNPGWHPVQEAFRPFSSKDLSHPLRTSDREIHAPPPQNRRSASQVQNWGLCVLCLFLGSDNSHTTTPKIPPNEEGLLWGWCVVRGPLYRIGEHGNPQN